MKIYQLSNMKDGWFIGCFSPCVLRTHQFEAAYKVHKKGEDWPLHYQKIATEYNLLIHGFMKVCGREVHPGDIFVIAPMEKAKPVFITDCEVMVIKVPSAPEDKVCL